MNPPKIYDYLTQARAKLLDGVRPLSDEQYRREFPIGLGSLARTLTHIMICEYANVERIRGRQLQPYAQWPIQDENPPPFAELESAWRDQASITRDVLAAVRDWSQEIEYLVTPEVSSVNRHMIVRTTYGDIATQIALHEVHHRAQAMNMLRQFGVTLQDIDYNTLMYQKREA
jgi:uncharacterized damage-inducible protein DinB